MSKYIVDSSLMTGIADNIRLKTGEEGNLVFPAGFNAAIESLPSIEDMRDIKDKVDDIKDIFDSNESEIDKTITTPVDIASFSDGADDVPMALKVAVEPAQDLRGYDNPWPGGSGANKFEPLSGTYQGITFTPQSDGTVKISGTSTVAGWKSISSSRILLQDLGIAPGDVLAIWATHYLELRFYDSDNTAVGGIASYNSESKSYTVNDNAVSIMFIQSYKNGGVDAGVTINETAKFFVGIGSSFTAWTPYSNICPISGWTGANVTRTGKNLFTNNTFQQGGIDTNGNNSDAAGTYNQRVRTVGFIPLRAGTYTVSSAGEKRIYLRIYDTYGNFLSALTNELMPMTFTLSNDSKIRFALANFDTSTNITPSDVSNIQIEFGSTATPYEPYFGQTYSITFPSSSGTVYGGELTVNKDGSGELVVDRAKLYAKDVNFTVDPIALNDGTGYYLYKTSVFPNNINRISNVYRASTLIDQWENRTFGEFQRGTTSLILTVPLEANTLVKAKQWLVDNDPYFVYPLATPVTYELTDLEVIETLKGINNIWSDIGKINEVEYSADSQLCITNKFNELDSLLSTYTETQA